jgi:hypothetical protein
MFKNHKTFIIVLLALVFGLTGGVAGSIIARVYFLEDAFNVPLIGDINLNNRQTGSSLIFSNAKKVVVEQNQKIEEAASAGTKSLVGIYKKIKFEEKTTVKNSGKIATSSTFNINDSYTINDFARQGFILTSDGWILTDFLPDDLAKLLNAPKSTSTDIAIKSALKDYFILDTDKDVYSIDDIIADELSGYSFWKINAQDLPVKKLVPLEEIKNGQIALAINLDGFVLPATVEGLSKEKNLIKSSDVYDPDIILSEQTGGQFSSSFLLDLNGDIMGMINSKGVAKPIGSFADCIKCLLENKAIKRAVLGVNYVNLSDLIELGQTGKQQEGALIYENEKGVTVMSKSPASLAGLKTGDIILSINGHLVNKDNDLNYLVNQAVPGEAVDIEYLRGALKTTKKVILSE